MPIDSDPEPEPLVPAFTPVPVRPRRDGWTAEKQRLFIQALAETGLVTRGRGGGGHERAVGQPAGLA